jgi:hypothetical protein
MGGIMKWLIFNPFRLLALFLPVVLLAEFIIGCGRDDVYAVDGTPYVSSSTWSASGIRQPDTGTIVKEVVCLTYSYDGRGKLTLAAMPGWFNCCVDSITASARFSENTIYIEMKDYPTGGGCLNTCYYSIGCIMVNVPPDVYNIELFTGHSFMNPHREFQIDISCAVSDTACSPIYREN